MQDNAVNSSDSTVGDAGRRRFEPPCGPVLGVVDGLVVRARSIRYARADRFALPERVDRWIEPHEATSPAPACPQLPSPYLVETLGGPVTTQTPDEDCLRLTVTRPTDDTGDPLPVVVWVHGGSYVLGAGDDPHFDPDALVAEERIVFVAVTYRLGIFGFLGDGSPERPANLGLLDIMAALEWVQENVGAFGGDPDRITMMGQSAGGDAIAHLLAVPAERRLFRRAIVQSAPLGLRHNRTAMTTQMFDRTRHLDASSSVAEILDIQAELIADGPRYGLKGLMAFGPQYGHDPLPADEDIEKAWARGASGIELLIGYNRDETDYFLPQVPRMDVVERVPIVGPLVRRLVSRTVTRIVYSRDIDRFARDHAAAGGTAIRYRIDWHVPTSAYGAAHCIELPLLFGSEADWESATLLTGAPWSQIADDGRVLRSIWGRFIRGEDLGAQAPPEAAGIVSYRPLRPRVPSQ